MSRVVKFAAIQLSKSWDLEDNLNKAKKPFVKRHKTERMLFFLRNCSLPLTSAKSRKQNISSWQKKQKTVV